MCIWDVREGQRHCDYCVYLGPCEKWPSPFQINEDSSDIGEFSKEDCAAYIQIMNSIMDADILDKCRKQNVVWARNFVAYQLSRDGYSSTQIGRIMNKNHSAILHALKNARTALSCRALYDNELKIWYKFQEIIKQRKNEEVN